MSGPNSSPYAFAGPVPPPPVKAKRRGPILLLIGLVLLVGGGATVVIGANGMTDIASTPTVRDGRVSKVQLRASTVYVLMAPDSSSSVDLSYSIIAPDGERLALDRPSNKVTVVDFRTVAEFKSTQTGFYEFDIDTTPADLTLHVVERSLVDEIENGLLVIGFAAIAGLVGLIVVVIGLIVRGKDLRTSRKAAALSAAQAQPWLAAQPAWDPAQAQAQAWEQAQPPAQPNWDQGQPPTQQNWDQGQPPAPPAWNQPQQPPAP
ncbi:MAG: hypothetical protein LBL55_00030, partial [Propionibacteriaceae bacterium]|nr:hypothetical protein [Propionibacteriaceae bacterium]